MDGSPLPKLISGRCNHRETGSPLARVMHEQPSRSVEIHSQMPCVPFPTTVPEVLKTLLLFEILQLPSWDAVADVAAAADWTAPHGQDQKTWEKVFRWSLVLQHQGSLTDPKPRKDNLEDIYGLQGPGGLAGGQANRSSVNPAIQFANVERSFTIMAALQPLVKPKAVKKRTQKFIRHEGQILMPSIGYGTGKHVTRWLPEGPGPQHQGSGRPSDVRKSDCAEITHIEELKTVTETAA
ncbi:hypothetical protein A6R68_18359 [Neotoma lepida]|uniref:Uncharacterized protein n=1 Tax=Neotoma lepida TaxID=56216 RepID=A0A1A6HMN0_NEOLE|nr:hypothetical protein A6R68_18359 [Neotoma lepida]